jgi:hypothetical protein
MSEPRKTRSFSTILHSQLHISLTLGFWAGRTREFNQEQLDGLTELVLNDALPAMLNDLDLTSRLETLARRPARCAWLRMESTISSK